MRDLEYKNVSIENLKGKNYMEIAETILKEMLEDFSESKIRECVVKAYSDKFSDAQVTPVVKAGDFYITELFHGPTSAFKDVALSILPHLMKASYVMNDIKGEIIILVATSGDTGKAALEGFKNIKGTKIVVFYPEDGVSQVQKYQMITQEGTNTYVCGIKGNFDDAQRGVKKIFTNEGLVNDFKARNKIFSSANSINVGRLVPQIVYYFYSYIRLVDSGVIKMWDKVNFSVPTGNFGNILAGYYAKLLGLPVNKFLCGSNENNVLYDFIRTGVYDRNRKFYKTISPSMDILVSSNLERFLYYMSGKNNEEVKDLMGKLNSTGRYEISTEMKTKINSEFYAGCVFKKDTERTIKEVFEKYGYLLDTHTAVAYKTLKEYRKETGDETVSIIMSTASPYKFSRSVYESLYGATDKKEFEVMEELSKKTGVPIPENLKELNKKKILHTKVCEINEMEDYIKTFDKEVLW
jgi:threonine synthase